MARERFLYCLFNKNKRPLFRNQFGFIEEGLPNLLQPNGQPASLKFSPAGWPDALVKYARNIYYEGIFRDMTVPMEFVEDGYDILDYIMWQNPGGGVDAICYLGILKLDEFVTPYKYQSWYFSELNFPKFKQNHFQFRIEALEGGMVKMLKSFENVKYTIDVADDPEHVNVLFDGITLLGKQTFLFSNQVIDPFLGLDHIFFTFLAVKESAEGSAPGIVFLDSFYEGWLDSSADVNTNFFARRESGLTSDIRVRGVLRVRLNIKRDNTVFTASITKTNQLTPFPLEKRWIYNIFFGVGTIFTTNGEIQNIPYDFTIPMIEGDKLFINGSVGAGSNTGRSSAFEILDDSTMIIDYTGKGLPTYGQGLYASRVFEQVAKQMVGTKDILSPDNVFTFSNWLANKKDLLIASSDSIRNLEHSKIKTSLKELFQSLRHFGIGLEVKNQKIIIELYDEFYKDDIIFDLGEVSKCELTAADDLICNTIKVGGPEIDYEDVNGKFESNQLQEWTTPIARVINELDLSTPYRRDSRGMEFLRLGLKGKDTTDAEGDNDIFMINIETIERTDVVLGLTYYRLNRPPYLTIEGIPFTDDFNLEYTPKHTIINNLVKIMSMLDRKDGENIIMANASKNRELKTNLAGFIVDQDANVQVNTSIRKWQPYYFNFVSQIPVNLLALMDLNPYGVVRFTFNNKEWFFRFNDGGIKPGDNDAQQWKALVAGNNDLSKFRRK